MSIYSRDDERAIRLQRLVDDWTKSGLLQPEQSERMLADLEVDLRRTNIFLRITLFLFGFLIVNALAGLFAVTLNLSEGSRNVPADRRCRSLRAGAVGVERYRLYRFGIEEAVALSAVPFFGAGVPLLMRQRLFDPAALLGRRRGFHPLHAIRLSLRRRRGESCSPASSR